MNKRMNKRGGVFLGLVIGFMLFMAGMIVLNFIKDDVTSARVALDCDNQSISDGAKLTCLGVDGVVPYFIILILSTVGGIAFGRFMG